MEGILSCCCPSGNFINCRECFEGLLICFKCTSLEKKCLEVLDCSGSINSVSKCCQGYWAFQSSRLNCCLQCWPSYLLIYLGYSNNSKFAEGEDKEKEKEKEEKKEEEAKKMLSTEPNA